MATEKDYYNGDDRSVGEMLAEILRLSLKLLFKCMIKLVRLLVRGCVVVFFLFRRLLQSCVDFWNDNSTQQKLHMAKVWFHAFLRTLVRLTVKGLKALARGLVWAIRAFVRCIINLRPTLVLVGKVLGRFGRTLLLWLLLFGRGCRLFAMKRKRAYLSFRRNKGFKGLMMDVKNYLQLLLNNYMDEEQTETGKNVLSYEEYIRGERGGNNDTGTLGKKIYNGMKNIIDGD